MKMSTRKSRRYARMFLGSIDAAAVEKSLQEMSEMVTLAESSHDVHSLLMNPAFSDEEREGALKAVGEKLGMSGQTIRFIVFLTHEGAASAMSDVLRHAKAIYAEGAGRVAATVVTPDPLEEAYGPRILQALKQLTGKEVDVDYEVDATLIGGMLVKVGSKMYDGSIKGQLRLLKDELLKGVV